MHCPSLECMCLCVGGVVEGMDVNILEEMANGCLHSAHIIDSLLMELSL